MARVSVPNGLVDPASPDAFGTLARLFPLTVLSLAAMAQNPAAIRRGFETSFGPGWRRNVEETGWQARGRQFLPGETLPIGNSFPPGTPYPMNRIAGVERDLPPGESGRGAIRCFCRELVRPGHDCRDECLGVNFLPKRPPQPPTVSALTFFLAAMHAPPRPIHSTRPDGTRLREKYPKTL